MVIVAGGMIISFVRPMMELKEVLTRLDSTIKNLDKFVTDLNTKNDKEHDILFDESRNLSERLLKLETEYKMEHGKE